MLTAKVAEPGPNSEELSRLQRERLISALQFLRVSVNRIQIDPPSVTAGALIAASHKILEAELAIEPRDLEIAHGRYVELMRYLDKMIEKMRKAGVMGNDALAEMHEARLDAEIKLLEIKRTRPQPGD